MTLPPSMAQDPATSAPAAENGERAFTAKALIFGVVCALIVVVGAWFNDQYLWQSPAIGNFFPPLPIGLAVLLAVGWNPTFGRISGLLFSVRELAVVLCFVLMVSWLPVSGFFRYFQRALVTPQVQADNNPDWRKADTMGHLPAGLFPSGGGAELVAMRGAILAERQVLANGGLDQQLAAAGTDAAAYAGAIDLASLVPPRMWRDEDQIAARKVTELALLRAAGPDPQRWASAGELLKGLPGTLAADSASPAAWRLVRQRLGASYAERLPAARLEYERVYTGMTQGLPVGDEILPLSGVPWSAWLPALAFWMPLVLFLVLMVVMLSLIVHRQWSHHEQLNYPIAAVASSFIQRDQGGVLPGVMRSRLFWAGLIPILLLHLLNYIAVWFPGYVPQITLHWGQAGLVLQMFPTISQAGNSYALAQGDIFFTIIGLAYFISSEVSFTMGIAGIAVVLFNVQFYAMSGTTADLSASRSGAYLGYALILLYTGRTYYWAVAVKAFGLRGGASDEQAESVWAARLFLLGAAGFVSVLVAAFGLDWLIAIAYTLTLMILFLVFTRVVCETGVPFLQAAWHPANLLINTLGMSAVGPGPLVLLYYLSTVMSQDPRECLMPYAANAMKVAENTGVKRFRLAITGFVVIAIALIVGFIAITWGMYNFGSTRDGYAQQVAAGALNQGTRDLSMLVDTGQYAATAAASGLEKLPLIAENTGKGRELGWIAFGLLAVVTLAVIRFRFAGFYLHPVLFLVWDTYPAARVWLSFLIGWIAKELIVRFGGGRVYQNLKPLFIGLIAGELIAVLVTLTTGWIYHLSTGLMPKTMWIFAG